MSPACKAIVAGLATALGLGLALAPAGFAWWQRAQADGASASAPSAMRGPAAVLPSAPRAPEPAATEGYWVFQLSGGASLEGYGADPELHGRIQSQGFQAACPGRVVPEHGYSRQDAAVSGDNAAVTAAVFDSLCLPANANETTTVRLDARAAGATALAQPETFESEGFARAVGRALQVQAGGRSYVLFVGGLAAVACGEACDQDMVLSSAAQVSALPARYVQQDVGYVFPVVSAPSRLSTGSFITIPVTQLR